MSPEREPGQARWLIRGARPLGGLPADILIEDALITGVAGAGRDGRELATGPGTIVIEASDLIALPGLVDLHTHLREPGREDAETVASGTAAAALGGYTAVHAMANTEPVADTAGVVEQVWRLGRRAGHCDVRPVGAVIAQHAQEPRLTEAAQVNEGEMSARLGLAGWPAVAEEAIIARDCLLAAHVGSAVHICHVSTAGSVEIIRWAKSKGWQVTAEVTPHHLMLTDDLATSYDPVFKVNPPLRTAADVAALRAGLADGTIDCVATDHAPHPAESKETEWSQASSGMTGLETALRVVHEAMVNTGLLDWSAVADRMSVRPAAIGRLSTFAGDQAQLRHGCPIAAGSPANLVLYDPEPIRPVDPAAHASRSRNSPFAGMKLPGQVIATFLRGAPTVLDGRLTS